MRRATAWAGITVRDSVENDIRVNSWDELNEEIFREAWQEDIGRFRLPYAFRGMKDQTHDLKTTLIRLGGPYDRLEGNLLRNFIKYAHRDATWDNSIWNWLSLAQHHGLPTRLTDWTYSPFVALHFVTEDLEQFDHDGVIWCVDFIKAREYLPEQLRQSLIDENAYVFHVQLLSQFVESLAELDRLSDDVFMIFLEPPSLDDRIVNQSALFSFMSSPTSVLNEWLMDKPDLYKRIIIPASLKWEVRDKLDQLNITERVLFPGLDGLGRWLKRQYSPGKVARG
jgi:hypothetical protein